MEWSIAREDYQSDAAFEQAVDRWYSSLSFVGAAFDLPSVTRPSLDSTGSYPLVSADFEGTRVETPRTPYRSTPSEIAESTLDWLTCLDRVSRVAMYRGDR